MIYWQLFSIFFTIGLFTIGGGYAAMPLIERQVVEQHAWLTMPQFADVVAIVGMTPGPIAVNSATFVGIRVGGIVGGIVSALGCVLPSFVIVLILAHLYYRFRNLSVVQGILSGLRPAIIAMLASAGLSLLVLAFWKDGGVPASLENVHLPSILIFIASFLILRKWKCSPIVVMIGAGVAGMIFC